MCFYDCMRFTCGDWKWGHFKAHCSKDLSTGETCGTKLIVFESLHVQEICEICIRIQTKYGRIAKEQSRIKRWRPEVNRRASINSAQDRIVTPEREIHELTGRRTIN
ncbi:hypothetical protein BDZ45DRAFT_563927, partial [Acephala macrosclerotiorum]